MNVNALKGEIKRNGLTIAQTAKKNRNLRVDNVSQAQRRQLRFD